MSLHRRCWRAFREEVLQNNLIMASFAIGVSILAICFSIYFFSRTETVQKNVIYPFPYRTIIETYSKECHVDSCIILAMIKTESKFDISVLSHRGAIGLMQLMPDTAKWVAGELDDKNFSLERLKDPSVNLRYGIWYYASLRREFHGNDVLALAAYNAGLGNVREWMEMYGWDMSFSDIRAIPYWETREYVRRVMKDSYKYAELYHDGK